MMGPNFQNSRRRWFDAAILAVLVLALLGPFLGRAFHIDDPLFVWAARHIAAHPTDPYGFEVLWDLTREPFVVVSQNPPGACYWLAIVGSLFGWSEFALHTASLLPAWGVVWGTYRLAERLGAPPLPAALLTVATPVFLVCSASVMSDVPMVFGWVWAIVIWDAGLSRGSRVQLYLAGVLIALTTLMKYFGVCLIPLLAAYSLARDRTGWRQWVGPLLTAIAILIAYQVWTKFTYGRGLFTGAMGFAVTHGPPSPGAALFRFLVGLTFTGGCIGVAALFAPFLLGRRGRWAVVGVIALALVLALMLDGAAEFADGTKAVDSPFASDIGYGDATALLLAQFAIWSGAGAGLLLLTLDELRRRRDPAAVLVALWVFGVFVFASCVNWTVNGRTILPLAPPVGILLAWRLERMWGPAGWSWRLPALLAPSISLAVLVLQADSQLASAGRTAAHELTRHYARNDQTLWFEGHWGFQYYMTELGAAAWDYHRGGGREGDRIVIPANSYYVFLDLPWRTRVVEKRGFAASRFLTTMHAAVGAGFYAQFSGPLPFAFAPGPDEDYTIEEFVAPATTDNSRGR